ncbi:hypothetical protein [Streptomyces sp. NPDC060366]|uniref:hypothetical protein n=1 Tax=Streptomyces sp. NPDC060366 TaxID=3347105 RepID=UPI003666A8D0
MTSTPGPRWSMRRPPLRDLITAADTDTVHMAVLALPHGLAFLAWHGPAGTRPTSDLVAGVVGTLIEGIRRR